MGAVFRALAENPGTLGSSQVFGKCSVLPNRVNRYGRELEEAGGHLRTLADFRKSRSTLRILNSKREPSGTFRHLRRDAGKSKLRTSHSEFRTQAVRVGCVFRG